MTAARCGQAASAAGPPFEAPPSVQLWAVAALLDEAVQLLAGRLRGQPAAQLERLGHRVQHVLLPVARLAAQVEVPLLLHQRAVHALGLRLDLVLDVDLVGAVAREGWAQVGEHPLLRELLQLVAQDVVLLPVAAAEEQPHLPGALRAMVLDVPVALLGEREEGRNTGARTCHHHGHLRLPELEGARRDGAVDGEHARGLVGVHALEVVRAGADLLLPLVVLERVGDDGELDAARGGARRRSDGI
mmetsp:Transcript_85706/g.242694  ORF Transcript_85706/g.242694 Transcript_85706/m.242694 type:complete len:245 (+) Transcript_85706:595-1329(+)